MGHGVMRDASFKCCKLHLEALLQGVSGQEPWPRPWRRLALVGRLRPARRMTTGGTRSNKLRLRCRHGNGWSTAISTCGPAQVCSSTGPPLCEPESRKRPRRRTARPPKNPSTYGFESPTARNHEPYSPNHEPSFNPKP